MRVFVSMPYGKKTGPLYEGGPMVEIDFDDVWDGLISRAIPRGWHALRADLSSRAGPIEQEYLECLLSYEVVIGDITFHNPNVFYELGLRDVFVPSGSILIGHRDSKLPVCLQSSRLIHYSWRDAPTTTAFPFIEELHAALVNQIKHPNPGKNQVHILWPGMTVDVHGGMESIGTAELVRGTGSSTESAERSHHVPGQSSEGFRLHDPLAIQPKPSKSLDEDGLKQIWVPLRSVDPPTERRAAPKLEFERLLDKGVPSRSPDLLRNAAFEDEETSLQHEENPERILADEVDDLRRISLQVVYERFGLTRFHVEDLLTELERHPRLSKVGPRKIAEDLVEQRLIVQKDSSAKISRDGLVFATEEPPVTIWGSGASRHERKGN